MNQCREHIYGTSRPATFSTGELPVATFQGFQDKEQDPDQQEAARQRKATPWETAYRLHYGPDGQNHDQSRCSEGNATSPVPWPCRNSCRETRPQLCCRSGRDENPSDNHCEA